MHNSSIKKRTLLFVFHEANLTGASIVLFRYVSSLARENKYNLIFILNRSGKLENELRKIGTVFLREEYLRITPLSLVSRVYGRVSGAKRINAVKSWLREQEINLICFNTLGAAHMISEICSFVDAPVAWYIHELQLAARKIRTNITGASGLVKLWIANSEATADFIEKVVGIPRREISIFQPPVELKINKSFISPLISQNKFVVGSAGTAMTRKGSELFIQLAFEIKKKYGERNLQFVWVGNTDGYVDEINHDLEKADLKGWVTFTGEVDNPADYYKSFKVFVSTSKEESFGLACAEAAALGKPIVAFQRTGGLEEVVKGSDGFLVPYLDVIAMAEVIVRLSEDSILCAEKSAASISYSERNKSSSLYKMWCEFIERVSSQNAVV